METDLAVPSIVPPAVVSYTCSAKIMGIYDRDYYRQPSTRSYSVGRMNMWSITTWLIVINIAVFLLDRILAGGFHLIYAERISTVRGIVELRFMPLEGLGHFSFYTAIHQLELWRFITFQFLHASLWHILFNMFALFFFGPLVESYLGRGKFLAFYLLCGIGGPIAYLFFSLKGILIASPYVPLIGASAGIFGILIAAARIAPNATVLIYGILPMQLKTLAWVLLAVAVYTVLSQGTNAGGEAAHLGGAGVGFLLIRNPWLLQIPKLGLFQRRRPF